MIGGIVEIAEPGRHLAVYRGFLKVSERDSELGRVPLDDVSALILSGPQITLSKQVMVELAERKSVIVTCGRNWHPISMTLPFAANFQSAGILKDQIEVSEPVRKRMWQKLVVAKIEHQATVLAYFRAGHPKIGELNLLARRVKSGDPENMEAQAARHYWRALMGDDFRRDRFRNDANMYFNYGYTVLRAATARAVCAAGLHPALGLHHGSRVNDFALVDDLMEPYRPVVDMAVARLVFDCGDNDPDEELTPERKRELVKILQQDMLSENGASPLANCLGTLARSVVESIAERAECLICAKIKPADTLV